MRFIHTTIRRMASVDLACEFILLEILCKYILFVLLILINYSFAALRLKYRSEKDVFLEANIAVKEPFYLFKSWLNEACETSEIREPNAFCLCTVSK